MDRPRMVSSTRGRRLATEPVSRILSCAVIPLGAALPRTLISNLPGGFGTCSNRLSRIGPMRRAAWFLRPARPSLFGLAPCGVYRARCVTTAAVRSYRTFSPLPQRVKSKLFTGCCALLRKAGSRGGLFSVALAVYRPLRLHPGRYPAHCPSEFGLSSPGLACLAASSPAATARLVCWILFYRYVIFLSCFRHSRPALPMYHKAEAESALLCLA